MKLKRSEIASAYEKLKGMGVSIKHPVSLIDTKAFDADGPNPMGGLMRRHHHYSKFHSKQKLTLEQSTTSSRISMNI